jgi:hypothetical protein
MVIRSGATTNPTLPTRVSDRLSIRVENYLADGSFALAVDYMLSIIQVNKSPFFQTSRFCG